MEITITAIKRRQWLKRLLSKDRENVWELTIDVEGVGQKTLNCYSLLWKSDVEWAIRDFLMGSRLIGYKFELEDIKNERKSPAHW